MRFSDAALTIERYETKYFIPPEMVEPISEVVEFYCQLDIHSQSAFRPDGIKDPYYLVNNLYLGSHQVGEYQEKSKKCELLESPEEFRFYMRVRTYGQEIRPPYFFELKYQVRDFVKKKRCQIEKENWIDILKCKNSFQNGNPGLSANRYLEDFVFMAMTYKVKPVLATQFFRKAYLSNGSNPCRVTFDRDYYYQENNDWKMQPKIDQKGALKAFGQAENVILELKYPGKMPDWMKDLVSDFKLIRVDFSKYTHSLNSLNALKQDSAKLHSKDN